MAPSVVLVGFLLLSLSADAHNVVLQSPPMGWNNWYTSWSLGKPFTEQDISRAAQALASTGLRDRGYVYVNLDCGWSDGYRDKQTGQVFANSTRFPSGLRGLGSFIHDLSLRYGIYTSGHQCCSPKDGDDGIVGHEQQDVAHFADMGFDFIKNDDCGSTNESFLKTHDAISRNSRPIVHSIHTSYTHGHRIGFAPQQASNVVQAAMWRTAGDIGVGDWKAIIDRARQNDAYAAVVNDGVSGQHGFNDPDILQVGNGPLTDAEGRSQFSLWCLIKAPLLIGCDVSMASKATLETLGNREAIAVNQDSLAEQGTLRFEVEGQYQVWAGRLAYGCHTALIVSTSDQPNTNVELRYAVFNASNITGSTQLTVRDLWTHADGPPFTSMANFTIPNVHGCKFLRLCPI